MNILKYTKCFFVLGVLLFSFFSCKKETVEIPYPYTDITSFLVDDGAGGKIELAVDKNTLTMYWPGYNNGAIPEFITPTITLAERATISPASGEKVALKDGMTYTVTAQNGSKNTYTLKVVNNQPTPLILAETPGTYTQYSVFSVSANYLLPSLTDTKLSLVGADGTEYVPYIINVSKNGIAVFLERPNMVPPAPGKYKVKIVTGQKTVISQTAYITIVSAPFAVPYYFNESAEPIVVKRGEQLTVPIKNLAGNTITRFGLEGYSTRFPVVGITVDGTGLIVTVPATFPLGDYYSPGTLNGTNIATGLTWSAEGFIRGKAPIRIVAN